MLKLNNKRTEKLAEVIKERSGQNAGSNGRKI
jgi:hypothetical protein